LTDLIDPDCTAAVIVNFRTADATVAAVRSLLASDPPVTSIFVVDNGSGDDSASRIRSSVNGIRLIEASANRGFSAGCNIGIRSALQSGADRILLLNPDACVSRAAVAEMTRLLNRGDKLGIVGAIIVSKSKPATIESAGISYSQMTGRMWNRDFRSQLGSQTLGARETVDAVSGCAMLVARAVFDRIGFFDEDYFFGFEDVDFCLRAQAAGIEIAIAGDATVEHEGHASIGHASPRRIYFAARNHLLLSGRNPVRTSMLSRWLRTGSILTLNLTHALFSSDVRRLDGLRAYVNGVQDHLTGRYGADR
jgi:GT2 family glycosyltransferase